MMDEAARRELGERQRRAVLGDAHVDRATAATTDFTAEFQDMITRHAWGEVWSRPGLDATTRRLLTLGMLVALNREEEFEMHVRAALQHGLQIDILKEVLLQSAIYCGVPAANAAFKAACRVLAEGGVQGGPTQAHVPSAAPS